jgi:hypothetical protein
LVASVIAYDAVKDELSLCMPIFIAACDATSQPLGAICTVKLLHGIERGNYIDNRYVN